MFDLKARRENYTLQFLEKRFTISISWQADRRQICIPFQEARSRLRPEISRPRAFERIPRLSACAINFPFRPPSELASVALVTRSYLTRRAVSFTYSLPRGDARRRVVPHVRPRFDLHFQRAAEDQPYLRGDGCGDWRGKRKEAAAKVSPARRRVGIDANLLVKYITFARRRISTRRRVFGTFHIHTLIFCLLTNYRLWNYKCTWKLQYHCQQENATRL